MELLSLATGLVIGYLIVKKDKNGKPQITVLPVSEGITNQQLTEIIEGSSVTEGDVITNIQNITGGYYLPPETKKVRLPIFDIGNYSGAGTTYQLLSTITLAVGEWLLLEEIGGYSDNPANCTWKLDIGGETNEFIAYSEHWAHAWNTKELWIPPETVINLYVKTDGTASTINSLITGHKETT